MTLSAGFGRDSYRESFVERERRMGTRLVDMDSQGTLHTDGTSTQREAIATFGLCGCTGITAIFEDPTDKHKKSAVVAHYSPVGHHFGQSETAGRLIAQETRSGKRLMRAVVMSPGEWYKDPETGKYDMRPKDSEHERVADYTRMIRDAAGSEAPIDVIGYSETRSADNTEQGTLLVVLNPTADERGYQLFVDGLPK